LRDEATLFSFEKDAEQAGDVEAVREGGGASVRFINEYIGNATFQSKGDGSDFTGIEVGVFREV
jgi:hypothetical protein